MSAYGGRDGVRSPRRWLRRGVVVVVIVVLLIVADWYQQNREMDHLLNAVQRSEKAMKQFESDEADELDYYKSHCNDASSYFTVNCEQAAQTLRTDVSNAAGRDVVNIQAAGADVEHVSMLPWHHALRSARDAYADHNRAWVQMLDKAASNTAVLDDKVVGANLRATWKIAHRRFEEALTPFALFHTSQRVDRIWAN